MNMEVQQIKQLVQPLIGMPVSRPWRGYGSAIFLEIGDLSCETIGKRESSRGAACIAVEWGWRIENDHAVLVGSSCSAPAIESHLASLKGVSIEAIVVEGMPPELVIHFSNGSRLRSMVMVPGDPQWTIRLPDDKWLDCEGGKVRIREDSTSHELSDEERKVIDTADATAKRWGKPIADPMTGECRHCECFVRLDGDFDLLDYGVCTNPSSRFDGRATNVSSGCPAFAARVQ